MSGDPRLPPTVGELPAPPADRHGWPWEPGDATGSAGPPEGAAWPRISIVVPSFAQGRYIEETLRSILLQDYPALELLVMDGGSQDETVEILRRYDRWIDSWVSEPDRGQTHAINKGLARATGEIFAYLNSDDLLAPGALQQVAAAFLRHPEAGVVHGRCVYVDEEGGELFSLLGRAESFAQYLRIWERFQEGDILTQPEVFCRLELVRRVGGFREELRSVMDFDMWVRLLSVGALFHAVDVPVALFRTHADQKSAVDPGHELLRVLEEHIRDPRNPLTDAERGSLLGHLPRVRAHLLVRGAVAATLGRQYAQALRFCASAVAADPRILATYAFWSVILFPVRKVMPSRLRSSIRRLLRGSR
jgi:hypothetical protein